MAESPDKIVNHAISIPVPETGSLETLETSDLFGVSGNIEVKGGNIELNLTGAPQYVTLMK